MSTPIIPLRQPAAEDLRNALQLAVCYGDKDIADSDAKQALERIRALIAQALAKLGASTSPIRSPVRGVMVQAGSVLFHVISVRERGNYDRSDSGRRVDV